MLDKSTSVARAVVSTLINQGVQHVVVAPGSRSAPLAIAFMQAEAAGLIKVHVRIDERDAGFLALGLAKASGNLVPMVVTSGSAVANLLPAVVEAYQSGVSLLVLSADRPIVARGKSAPQTIAQSNIFSSFAKANYDSDCDSFSTATFAELIKLSGATHRGPIHVNIQFEMPLVPTAENVAWTPEYSKVDLLVSQEPQGKLFDLPTRGVIVAGDIVDIAQAREVGNLAQALGWPIIAEPSANLHSELNTLAHGVLVVASNSMPTPECVLTVGTVGLSRPILNLLKVTPKHIAVHFSGNGPDLPDPVQSASEVLPALPVAESEVDRQWLTSWQQADSLISEVVSRNLQGQTLSGPSAALQVWNHAKDSDQLMVAASWPVRHLEAFAPKRTGLRVLGNRGANGIDGLISTAWGIADAMSGRTYLLIGDVAFLHDIGGLNVGEGTEQPNLTVVVLDNDGGGIFSQLEQGRAEFEPYFEKVFGTPHGKDLWQIAESFGFATTRVTTQKELESALQRTASIPGVHIVICLTGERALENTLIQRINSEIGQAL